MHSKRYKKLTLELCEQAVKECFARKWRRNDVLTFIEKYAGILRADIKIDDLAGNWTHKTEAIKAIGLALYGIIEDIVEYGIEPDDMEEVTIRQRPDGMTGKIRDIALLCIMHQLLGHAEKLMIEPLINARLLPTQHASIPYRGQTLLKDQVRRYLLKEAMGIRYVRKTDVVHAYATTQYSVCIDLVKKEIPTARHAIKLLEYLGRAAPGGHLIIGGYLDAWLFNLAMSYAIRYLYTTGTTRREKKIPYIIRCDTFMDDFALLSASVKGEIRAAKALEKWMEKSQGLKIKETTGIIKLLSVEEEQRRRSLDTPGKRGVPMLDMAGYRISRTHVTIRRRVFKRARRQLMRGYKELLRDGTLRVERAQKIISYYSYIDQSNSHRLKEKYHVQELMDMAEKVNSFYGWLINQKRREELNALSKWRQRQKAGADPGREFTGRGEDDPPGGSCGGIHAGGSAGSCDVPLRRSSL